MGEVKPSQIIELREIYLAEVSFKLAKKLTALDSFETIQEMRVHINAMAGAYEELGMSPFDAMQAALQKFGPSDRIGRDLARTLPKWRLLPMHVGLVGLVMLQYFIASESLRMFSVWLSYDLRINTVFFVYAGGWVAALIAVGACLSRLQPKRYAALICIPCPVMAFSILVNNLGSSMTCLEMFQLSLLMGLVLFVTAYSSARLAQMIKGFGKPIKAI